MHNVVDILERLFSYYNVTNVAELSLKINTSQATISSWKTRNSLNAIKKRCRELGIYDEIFHNETLTNEDMFNQRFEKIEDLFLDDTKFRLKEKMKKYTDDSFIDWLNKLIPKKILTTTLRQLAENKENYDMFNSKHSLLERIQTLELSFINKKNKHQISDYIKNNLSKIECYVLIQEHEEIMNYKGFWK